MEALGFLNLLLSSILLVWGRRCEQDEYRYEYTECSSNGERWRVSVPDVPDCTPDPSAPPPLPVKGKTCLFSCDPGYYLSLDTDQECHSCPAGTYSLGGGLRFDEWLTLPGVFVSRAYPNYLVQFGVTSRDVNCSDSQWLPQGEFLEAISEECTVELTLDVEISQKTGGKVTFVYQHSDERSLFHFKAENGCTESSNSQHSELLAHTSAGVWLTHARTLTGNSRYRFTWKVTALHSYGDQTATYGRLNAIRSIYINGVDFTSSCTKCPAGTYSSVGTHECSPCPADQYSREGSASCLPCNQQTEYSHAGSARCLAKPPCSSVHYTHSMGPCSDGKVRVKYSWLQPVLCNLKHPASVALPRPGLPIPCPPCNAGMSRSPASFQKSPNSPLRKGSTSSGKGGTADSDGFCHTCSDGTASYGILPCRPCSSGSVPNIGIFYTRWDNLPANVTTHCIDISAPDGECVSDVGWRPGSDGTYMESISPPPYPGLSAQYSLLSLKIDGFVPSTASSISSMFWHRADDTDDGSTSPTVTFTFELDCGKELEGDSKGRCAFLFMESGSGETSSISLVREWVGTAGNKGGKHTVSYRIPGSHPRTFTWAFQRITNNTETSGLPPMFTSVVGTAKIHSIKVTGTVSGGASTCEHCKLSSDTDGSLGCMSCPPGHYWHKLPPPTTTTTTTTTTASTTSTTPTTTITTTFAPKQLLPITTLPTIKPSVHPKTPLVPPTVPSSLNRPGRAVNSKGSSGKTENESGITSTEPRMDSAIGECKLCTPGYLLLSSSPSPSTLTTPGSGHMSTQPPPHTSTDKDRGGNATDSDDDSPCVQCPRGLYSPDYSTCISDCRFTSDKGLQFDFSGLAGNHSLSGQNIFSGDGTKYFHYFQFAVCNPRGSPLQDLDLSSGLVACSANATQRDTMGGSSVDAVICQTTILSPSSESGDPIATQPFSIGDTVSRVSVNDPGVLSTLQKVGFSNLHDDDILLTLHVSTDRGSHTACPGGRLKTLFTLHCDPLQPTKEGTLQIPPSRAGCSDTTCDGCTHVFVWHTVHACPKCEAGAYEVVEGQCAGGKREVHYIPPKHCLLLGQASKKIKIVDCSILPMPLWILIATVSSIMLVCFSCVICCWWRNRKLEYRYTQLKESGGDGTGGEPQQELPAPETCALGEDEDDEEEAFNVSLQPRKRFYGAQGTRDQFESVQLTSGRYSGI